MEKHTFIGQRFGYFYTRLVLEAIVDFGVGTEFVTPPFAFESHDNP